MKKVILIKLTLICLGLACYIIMCYFSTKNSERKLSISHDSGFYNDSIEVEITAPQEIQVYYTLDCSEPSELSNCYSGKIKIADRSNDESVLAKRLDFEIAKNPEYSKKYLGYVADRDYYSGQLDKCTVLKVAGYDKNGNCAYRETRQYFIGIDGPEYSNIRIVAINTEPGNLVDYENGIYVTGKKLDDFLEEYDQNRPEEPIYETDTYFWPANYRMQGRECERTAYATIFDCNKSILFDGQVGLKIRGKVSRAFAKKSLSICSRNEYNGSDLFNVDFFEDGTNLHSIKLDGNGRQVNGNDYIKHLLCKELNIATMDYIPCVVFLNGEYWGFYHISKDYDRWFVESQYGVGKNDVVLIKEGNLKEGTEEDREEYKALFKYIETHDMTDPRAFEYVASQIDIDSCIDYYAALLYFGRETDWPNGNFAVWRTSSIQNKPYYDRKFRYMIYDLEGPVCSPEFADAESLQYALEMRTSFASIMRNKEFNSKLVRRILELRNARFNPTIVNDVVDNYIAYADDFMEENNRRWYPLSESPREEFIAGMEDIKRFFEKRYRYYSEGKKIFGLYGYFESNAEVLELLWDQDVLNGSENVFYIVCAPNVTETLEYKVTAYHLIGDEVQETVVQDFSDNMQVIVEQDNIEHIDIEVRAKGTNAVLYTGVYLPEGYQN